MSRNEKLRLYFYGIALAAGPLLLAYGIVSADEWPLWAGVAGAILVPGLAMANVNHTGGGKRAKRDGE